MDIEGKSHKEEITDLKIVQLTPMAGDTDPVLAMAYNNPNIFTYQVEFNYQGSRITGLMNISRFIIEGNLIDLEEVIRVECLNWAEGNKFPGLILWDNGNPVCI